MEKEEKKKSIWSWIIKIAAIVVVLYTGVIFYAMNEKTINDGRNKLLEEQAQKFDIANQLLQREEYQQAYEKYQDAMSSYNEVVKYDVEHELGDLSDGDIFWAMDLGQAECLIGLNRPEEAIALLHLEAVLPSQTIIQGEVSEGIDRKRFTLAIKAYEKLNDKINADKYLKYLLAVPNLEH